MNEKRQEVFRVATEMFNQHPDWVTFFREVLGLDGVIRRAYPDPSLLSQFEQTTEYQQIQQMLAKLRETTSDQTANSKEPQRVITVRLPKSMHEALKDEAKQHGTSMNKLCISKLLQVVDDELVPTETAAAATAAAG